MARSTIILLLVLAFLGGIKCQSSETLARIESKLDNAQTSLLQAMMEQQNIQNQVLTNVVGLLQKHDEQMDNMNHILSGMSNLMEKQNQQLENMSDLLSQQQQSQTQMISNVALSLQDITER